MHPLPTQLSGALFLARQSAALLADEPRVGKTGAAVIAADYIFAETILVITTKSGRAVWRAGFAEWSAFPRDVQIFPGHALRAPVVIVSWAAVALAVTRSALIARSWDLVILDEDHYAKSFEAKRTQAVFGEPREGGRALFVKRSLAGRATRVWSLSGTPAPNSPADFYPRLRALAPQRLRSDPSRGWPDVMAEADFKKRYCVTRPMRLGRGAYKRFIDVIVGGKNEIELHDRLDGFMLRRTQADVGIRAPVHEIMPLEVSDSVRRKIEEGLDTRSVLAAAESGETEALEMHLGKLRRLTGAIKAQIVVEAVREEFECGLDKIVLMRWHSDVGAIIRSSLASNGVVTIDGLSSAADRKLAEEAFRDDPNVRVFDGQIQAAGEAIDLSAAAVLIFVETSFIPKDMKQASLRITNLAQKRQAFVRVAALAGSIDEAVQRILLRKWASIRQVVS